MMGIGGARFRMITGRNPEVVPSRRALAESALETLEGHLGQREWLVGAGPTIGDVSVFAYAHVAPDAGFDLAPIPPSRPGWSVSVRCPVRERPRALPDNARPGRSESIYD